MLRQLNEVQGDDSVVGFYQACTLGGFLRQSLIEQQALHQEKLRHGGIVVVHGEYNRSLPQWQKLIIRDTDVSGASRGVASLKAFRLSAAFRRAHKSKKFDTPRFVCQAMRIA
jgi:translation initiation factor 3 subunit H